MLKRFFALLLALTMLLSFASCKNDDDNSAPDTGDQTPEETVDPSKIIDIYLIAGQSNAVGHSRFFNHTQTSYHQQYLAQFAPELAEGGSGYSHIHYAGSSRADNVKNGISVLQNFDYPWQKIALGFGVEPDFIGPEVGMAKALSKYYNAETGRSAGIIKFAHSGTSLLNVYDCVFGNWVSPSYAESLGVSYNDTDITGGLYRGLLEQVERNVSELYEYGGYEQVNIKGLYWMQGEANRSEPGKYEIAFKYFAEDIRKDLSEIMLEFTGGESDCGASEMGIFVGAISQGFAITNANTESTINIPFINMQKRLAENIENCYFVDNSGYAITKWNPATNSAIVLGFDRFHWNVKDMLNIGNNVGKMMFEKCVKNDGTK